MTPENNNYFLFISIIIRIFSGLGVRLKWNVKRVGKVKLIVFVRMEEIYTIYKIEEMEKIYNKKKSLRKVGKYEI